MNKKITPLHICFVAMAICINLIGGQIALTLRLPIYLDSIGTMLTGMFLGPVYGMMPSFLSGIISGMSTDIYALYFAPVGMITGLMSGLVGKRIAAGKKNVFLSALMIAVPGTALSSIICAVLFGGITSSGSSVLIQLLKKPLGTTGSIFAVQIITDYADRLLSLIIVLELLKKIPISITDKLNGKR